MLFALLVSATVAAAQSTSRSSAANTQATAVTSCPSSPSVSGINSAFLNQFPPVNGAPASILAGDATARSLYNSITANASWSSLLALAPKPFTKAQGASTTGYSTSSDPDCWSVVLKAFAHSSGGLLPVVRRPSRASFPPITRHARRRRLGVSRSTTDRRLSTARCTSCSRTTTSRPRSSTSAVTSFSSQLPQPRASLPGTQFASHNYTTTLTNEQVFAEMYCALRQILQLTRKDTQLAIKRVVGVTSRCFRPPYGDVDDRVRVFAYALGMDVWLWDGETWASASGTSSATINSNFNKLIAAANGNSGVIVLTHETTLKIASYFVNNFAKISNAFNTIAGGHICNNITHPYAETDAPVNPSFAQYLAGTRTTGNLTAVVNTTAQLVLPGLGGALAFASAAPSVVPSASASPSGSASSSPSSATTAAAAAASPSSSKMSTSTIAAIVGGVAAGIIAIVLIALLILRRRSSPKKPATKVGRIGSPQSATDEKSPYPSQKDEYGHLASRSDLQVNTLDFYSQPPPMPVHQHNTQPSQYRAW